MKQTWAVIPMLFLGLVLVAGCGGNPSTAKKSPLFLAGTEVLPNIQDNQDFVFIKAEEKLWGNKDAVLADIMAKKERWEQQFPAKKVVMTFLVIGNKDGPVVIGLLVHYE